MINIYVQEVNNRQSRRIKIKTFNAQLQVCEDLLLVIFCFYLGYFCKKKHNSMIAVLIRYMIFNHIIFNSLKIVLCDKRKFLTKTIIFKCNTEI